MSMTPMLARQFLDCILLVGHLDQGRTGGEPRQAIKKPSNDLPRASFHRDVMVVIFLVFDILFVFVYMFVIPSHGSDRETLSSASSSSRVVSIGSIISLIAAVFSSYLFGQYSTQAAFFLAATTIIPRSTRHKSFLSLYITFFSDIGAKGPSHSFSSVKLNQ
jgi:hypothetical protein